MESEVSDAYKEGYAKGFREGYIEGFRLGLEQGERKKAMAIAQEMKAEGMPPDKISEITGLPKETIEGL